MTDRDVVTALRICSEAEGYEEMICADCPHWETCQHETGITSLLQMAADTIERLMNNAE